MQKVRDDKDTKLKKEIDFRYSDEKNFRFIS